MLQQPEGRARSSGTAEPPTAESTAAEPPTARVPTRAALGVGLATAVGIFVMRRLGWFDGMASLVAVALALPALLPSPRRYVDRVLVVAVGLLGWIPLLGWVPGLLTAVDLAGILAAACFGIAAAARTMDISQRRNRQQRDLADTARFDQLLAFAFDAAPIVVAAVLTRFWSSALLAGDSARRLRTLLAMGWDHAAHAGITWQILDSGSFSFLERETSRGADWTFWNYPQGGHYSGAFAIELASPSSPTGPPALLDSYIWVMVGAVGFAVLLATSAVLRLVRPSRSALVAAVPGVVAMAVLFGLGDDVVVSGFSTYFLSIAAIIVMGSLVMRPSGSWVVDLWLGVGALLIVMYNWYPLAVVAAPLALMIALPVIKRLAWWQTLLVAAAIGVACLAPAAFSLQTGADAANAVGGISRASRPGLVLAFVSLWLLTAATAKPALRRSQTLAVASTCGLLIVAAVVAYQLRSGGSVEYYAEKLATAVFLSTVGFAVLVGTEAASGWITERGPRTSRARVAAATVLLAVGASQIAGYAGPSWREIAGGDALFGLQQRDQVINLPGDHNDVIANEILMQAQLASDGEEAYSTMFVSVNPGESHPYIRDVWFSVFTQTFDTDRFSNALTILQMSESPPEGQPAALEQVLATNEAGPLTLLTTPDFAERFTAIGNPAFAAQPVLFPAP